MKRVFKTQWKLNEPRDLSGAERRMIAVLLVHLIGSFETCKLSNKEISNWYGCTERHARRIIQNLRERGIIAKLETPNETENIYIIRDLSVIPEIANDFLLFVKI